MQKNQWIWQHADWPDFYYDLAALHTDIRNVFQLIGGLEAICRTLNDEEQVAAQERTLADDAVETAAIEGEVLRRSSVRASIRKRLGLPVELDDWDARADGLVAMLLDARDKKPRPLTKERLLSWHAALFPTGYSGLQKIRVGQYRGMEEMQIISGPMGRETVHYIAPAEEILIKEMDRFLRWISVNNEQDPILKAGIAHVWFIMIHPFDDGNGRVGRAITDYLLAAHYPALMGIVSFSRQIGIDRKDYYRILETTGRDGLDITDWLTWFLQTLEAAMRDSQWLVERVVMKAHFWQQHKNTELNTRQQKVINRLLDTGEKFTGGMTTRKYAGMTKCSKVTASRDLNDLMEKRILQKSPGGGRSTSYQLCRINI